MMQLMASVWIIPNNIPPGQHLIIITTAVKTVVIADWGLKQRSACAFDEADGASM